ncbi:MAG: ORF6N domain-containing protein [Pyrinomonadaceae bacterium]
MAALYEVETRVLNQAVGRNRDRFPGDFAFELTRDEIMRISQIVTSSNLKFSKRVTAFTEQGVAMLSSVLRSKRAISVNIEIMRAFVKLRQMLASNADLSKRLDELEGKYDRQFKVVFDAIRELMSPAVMARNKIGFRK